MIKNKISYVDSGTFKIPNDLGSSWLAELDGRCIQTEEELVLALKDAFLLPNAHHWDAILDWLTDLDWLEKESYVLVIHHFQDFLCQNIAVKERFMSYLSEDVLPFWESDVTDCVVGGYPKRFQVYCLT